MNKFILLSLLLTSFIGCIILVKQNEQSSEQTLQAVEIGIIPTVYEWYYCKLNDCRSKRCVSGDKTCLMASYNYTKCYQETTACQLWDKEFETLQSFQQITLNYYDCHNTCRPKRDLVGEFWPIYVCDSNCAGAGIPTIYQYTVCRNLDCKFKCPVVDGVTDTVCSQQSATYANCKLNTPVCKTSQTLIEKSASDDPLPREYFLCDKACRPQNGTFFYNTIYGCEISKCAGVLLN